MRFQLTIPRAVQLVLDDVGWREGWSLADSGGPWRAGVDRLMEPEDYLAIAELGRRLNTRPQAAMVLCEWDRGNVCSQCPSCTQDGSQWDNSHRSGPWSNEVADVFLEHAANVELAMHGVGHEYWEDGERVRAEWYGAQDGKRWPWEDLLAHIDVFSELLDQHGLGPGAGNRFPTSAVPCAFNYYFDDADSESTGALFSHAGIERCSTPFGGGFHAHSSLLAADGGCEHGLLVIDRGSSGIPYDVFNAVPGGPTRNSICGIHWPNILAADPDENEEGISNWVGYLSATNDEPDMMLAANSAECFAQWVYHTFVTMRWDGPTLVLNGAAIPQEAWKAARQAPLWLKIKLPPEQHIAQVESNSLTVVAYSRDEDYALLGFAGMPPRETRLRFHLGDAPLSPVALRTGTHNILGLTHTTAETAVHVEVYGRAEIGLRVARPPASIATDNPRLRVDGFSYDESDGTMLAHVTGHDIQGERGTLVVGHASP